MQAPLKHGNSQIFDLDDPSDWPNINGEVVLSYPPPALGREDNRTRALIPHLQDIERLVYISTSGVYGDCAGEWVDESQPPKPITPRAQRRLDAEQQLQAWAQRAGAHLVILRVPGIYGPGRLPIQRLQAGKPVLDPAQSPWSNRIHADDLAGVLELALERGEGIYNVADGQPEKMSDYFLRCAKHLGLDAPPLISWAQAEKEFTPALMSFYRESRRLSIDKLRAELGFIPQYPNLEAGLPAC